MAATYHYLFLALARVATPHQALAERVRGFSGGDVVGQFAPQLGGANNEAAVLLRGDAVDPAALIAPPLVTASRLEVLTPTIRPAISPTR